MAAVVSLFAICFIVAAVADRLPFRPAVHVIMIKSKESVQTIASKDLADSQKQAVLLKNSLVIFVQSAKMLLLLVLAAVAGLFLVLVAGYFQTAGYVGLLAKLVTGKGIIISIVAFILYFLCRKMYGKARL